MPKTQVKKIVLQYAERLKKANYPVKSIYLFGSQAKGVARKDSDIDVAVVPDQFMRTQDEAWLFLWKMRRDVDMRIEPHGFTVAEFCNEENPLVYEIRTTGICVA